MSTQAGTFPSDNQLWDPHQTASGKPLENQERDCLDEPPAPPSLGLAKDVRRAKSAQAGFSFTGDPTTNHSRLSLPHCPPTCGRSEGCTLLKEASQAQLPRMTLGTEVWVCRLEWALRLSRWPAEQTGLWLDVGARHRVPMLCRRR